MMDLLCDHNQKENIYDRKPQPPTAQTLPSRPFLMARLGVLPCLKRVAQGLIPSFLAHKSADRNVEPHPTAYLDGIRGFAAFAVFLCHLSYGTWDTTHVFGAGGAQENRSLLQLPIVRLAYSGPPMVAIFFVVSGYALSYKHIKLMHSRDYEKLMMTLSSAIFRRAIRLFLPCFVSTFGVAILCQLGAYEKTADFAHGMRAIAEEHAWTAPDFRAQLRDWAHQMMSFVNVFDWSLYSGSIAQDRHLWTIPAEYRCSMALFVTHAMTARMMPRLRLSTLLGLICWGTLWNRWEMIPFWAGSMLAEIDLIHGESSLNSILKTSLNHKTSVGSCRSAAEFQWLILCTTNLVCGLYLASFPDADGHITPGYIYLNSLIPEFWTETHRFWPTIAAVQIVWSVSRLCFVRAVFSSSVLQYFGCISFPLYVVHGPVIHTFGYMVMSSMYIYTSTDDQYGLIYGFVTAAIMTTMVVIWVADVFWRVVDLPSVQFAKWLEEKAFFS